MRNVQTPGLPRAETVAQGPDGNGDFAFPDALSAAVSVPGQKGPPRVVSIASKQNLAQQALVQALDLEELVGSLSKPRG